MISVICPIYDEIKYIEKCILSMIEQDYPKEDMEVLFVDGMSTDGTRDIVKFYSEQYPFIRLLDNTHKIVPYAMNKGIEESKGDIIIRIDAHALYPNNYVSYLSSKLIELDADNVGVVCKTDVLNKTPQSLAIQEVLSNKFGVGNSYFRVGVDKIKEVDTVPFGCYKKDVFEKYGYYDTRFVKGQDIELNKRLKQGGAKIYLLPDITCTYFARETVKANMKNQFNVGRWTMLVMYYKRNFKSISLRHFIPLIFVCSLLVPLLFSILWWPLSFIALLSLLSYFILLSYVICKVKKDRSKCKLSVYWLFVAFLTTHFSRGWGSLITLCKLPFLKRDNK